MPKKKTTEEFIQNAIKIYYDKYDYSKVVYIKSSENVIIICKIHGEFLTNPGNHINSRSGCPTCAGNKSYTIEYCKKIATENGGECLSKEYKNLDDLQKNIYTVILLLAEIEKQGTAQNMYIEKEVEEVTKIN